LNTPPRPWSIVLAGGDGKRLRCLTTDAHGVSVPKQYCSLQGGVSLLRLAFERAARVSLWHRITAVVAEQHHDWWKPECEDLPATNTVPQPINRGTAPGVLLPLLAVLSRDPDPLLVVYPSDHFVADEDALEDAVRHGLAQVARDPEKVVLLGMTPDDVDSAFGWIVPGDAADGAPNPVERFVEKPPASLAMRLLERGGLWNSFILVARGRTLLDLYRQRIPGLLTGMKDALELDRLSGGGSRHMNLLYEGLDATDFSRNLLQGAESRLSVVPVRPCGWSDLGTPERVARCVEQLDGPAAASHVVPLPVEAPLSLAGRA
jgi:mannose-1-phosphate guanylyltransferase